MAAENSASAQTKTQLEVEALRKGLQSIGFDLLEFGEGRIVMPMPDFTGQGTYLTSGFVAAVKGEQPKNVPTSQKIKVLSIIIPFLRQGESLSETLPKQIAARWDDLSCEIGANDAFPVPYPLTVLYSKNYNPGPRATNPAPKSGG